MAEHMNADEWLAVIRKEYMQDFVKGGGAAVKFIVPVDGTQLNEIKLKLKSQAESENFMYASVDATVTKVHLIDQMFFAVAAQIDWDGLTQAFLRRLLTDHYKLPEAAADLTVRNIAILNGYEERDMRPFLNERLKKKLFQEYSMTQEFRTAMMMLCRAQLDPEEVGDELKTALIEWLGGELRLISALKRAVIFQKIARHNARNLLLSLAHWSRLCGWNGLSLSIDISRYTQDPPRPRDPETLYYSSPAMLNCYEVLRQFVDGTDEAGYCFITVIAPSRFVEEGEKRSVGKYQALKLRIWDDVRDRTLVNPLSPLVRISSCQTAVTRENNEQP